MYVTIKKKQNEVYSLESALSHSHLNRKIILLTHSKKKKNYLP